MKTPTQPPYADNRPIKLPPRPRLALAALACAAGLGLPLTAARAECAAAGGPTGAAGTSALYGTLSDTVNAEPLSVDITAKTIGGMCTWVYEVKVLTVQGSVAILDFDLGDLDLRHVEGPVEDPEVARLTSRLGGSDKAADAGSDDGSSSDGDSDDGGSDGGGSGGSGGEGGSGSGGEGGDGGGSDGSDGSDGGEGGSGGGSDGGGEGGEGGSGH